MTPLDTMAKIITLTPEQERHLPAARAWLRGDRLLPGWFDPNENRRGGRTVLIAFAAMLEALANPGREVLVTDHACDGTPNESRRLNRLVLAPEIDRLLKAYRQFDGPGWWRLSFNAHRNRVVVSFGAIQARVEGVA